MQAMFFVFSATPVSFNAPSLRSDPKGVWPAGKGGWGWDGHAPLRSGDGGGSRDHPRRKEEKSGQSNHVHQLKNLGQMILVFKLSKLDNLKI